MLTVYNINEIIKNKLNELSDIDYKISGEISNAKQYNNVLYFTLKDNESAINCIHWDYNNVFTSGDKVVVIGRINCYIKNGSYQINVHYIEKIGIGKNVT